jgi:hypothetical protein
MRGVAAERIEVARFGTVICLGVRDGGATYFPVLDLDNFREGEEHPSVVALLGPLDGAGEEEAHDGT